MKKIARVLRNLIATAIVIIIAMGSANTIAFANDNAEVDQITQAAITLRDNMIARNENIEVVFTSTDANINNLVTNIYTKATGTELADTAEAGDYLAYSIGNYRYNGYAKRKNNEYEYHLTFAVTYYTTAKEEMATTTAIEKALNNLNLGNETDYAKAKKIYDYICSVCNYDTTTSTTNLKRYTAYGAIVKGKAVCQGYATLLQRMLLEAGLDARVITNTTHAWNIVKIGNLYYNLDATWDDKNYDANKAYTYFLKCNKDFENHKRDAKFDTAEFNAEYKMAGECYGVNCNKVTVKNTTIKAITAEAKGFALKWNKVAGVNYQIQYSTNKNFTTATTKSVNITNNATITKHFKKLTAKKKYFVRIRTYKTQNGKKYYSNWTAAKNVTTKK